jgi:anthranilate synthase component 2
LHKFNNFDLHFALKILIIDNYDSFTYNLAHYIEGVVDQDVDVVRNDVLSIETLHQYDKIVISPGPGLPRDAGLLLKAIQVIPESTPVLAVCLGMQAYAENDGISLYNLKQTRHGVDIQCKLDTTCIIFHDLPSEINVGLYHSWAVDKALNSNWKATSTSAEGVLMSMSHARKPIHCVQFHPESVLTPKGKQMIDNFISKT